MRSVLFNLPVFTWGVMDIGMFAVSDGIEGLDAVQKLRPDLSVLDIMLPRVDGFEVRKKELLEENGAEEIFTLAKAINEMQVRLKANQKVYLYTETISHE